MMSFRRKAPRGDNVRQGSKLHPWLWLAISLLSGVSCSEYGLATAAEGQPPPAATSPQAPVPSEPASPPCALPFTPVAVPVAQRRAIPAREVRVWTPCGEAPAEGWPFLMVLDGDLADRRAFAVISTLRRLIQDGRVPATVVIAVPSRVDRNRELSARASRFVDFLADAVWPAVHEDVPLSPAGAVVGYSYGGLVAVTAGAERPDRFDTVIAMSPSLWFRRRVALRKVRRAPRLARRWWVDIGSLEGRPGEAVPYMVADARRLRDLLIGRGLVLGESLGYFEAPGRRHSPYEAAPRMPRALAFALAGPAAASPAASEGAEAPGRSAP